MSNIHVNPQLIEIIPELKLGIIEADVVIEKSSPALVHAIEERLRQIRQNVSIQEIAKIEGIKWGRYAYRKLGKDPTKYRLSSEKLMRRVLKHEPFIGINNLVDLMNWISIETQGAIGVFDQSKIKFPCEIDFGRAGETFDCLAGYTLNLEGLPIIRDSQGAFGSTTSDAIRTCIETGTQKTTMVFYAFDPLQPIEEDLKMVRSLLSTYISAKNIKTGTL